MYSFELRFAKVYKAFSSEVHAFRLVFSGWGVKSLSTYPMTVGLLEKKVIHGTSEPTMYGYIKNHKKTVKNGQSRTQETEEYKRAKDSKLKVNYVKSRALIDHLSIKATWLWKKAQGKVDFTLGSLREVAQAVTSRMTAWQSLSVHT
ncbi:hypothetical protein Tco_1183936 [Tanacetum coccineum]